MNLLIGTFSVVAGLSMGIFMVTVLSALLPGLIVNLGLHGTLLCVLGALVVVVPWLRENAATPRTTGRAMHRMLLRAFAVGVALRVLAELAFSIFGVPNPEQMTWGDQVVILGGRRTFQGWLLLARGCIESGFTGAVLCGAVAALAHAMKRFRTARRS